MRENITDRKLNFLLVEDSPDDVTLFQLALKRGAVKCDLNIVTDGETAVEYLAGEKRFADRSKYPIPDAVILDIKMPRKSGLEVLDWIRADSPCPELPVVMFSSSDETSDRQHALQRGVVGYFVKPLDNEQLSQLVKHWITLLS